MTNHKPQNLKRFEGLSLKFFTFVDCKPQIKNKKKAGRTLLDTAIALEVKSSNRNVSIIICEQLVDCYS